MSFDHPDNESEALEYYQLTVTATVPHFAERNCRGCGDPLPPRGSRENEYSTRVYCSIACRERNLLPITPDLYDQFMLIQDGRCAICRELPGKTRLAVDHDHSCCGPEEYCEACVRGLLCMHCNTAIGLFRERPDWLRMAARYVEVGGAVQYLEELPASA